MAFKNLNIGGSLTALMHAYVTETPIIIDIPHMPFELEKCPAHWDLSFLGFSRRTEINKINVWERLTFLLSMAGLVVFPNNIKSARCEENNMILVLTGNKRFKVTYQKLFSFDRDTKDYVLAYDWFDVKTGSVHAHQNIYDTDNFCHEVIFYPSNRNGTKKGMMDACAVSKIPCHLVDDIDYSPIYARLKVISMMRSLGIKGKVNGYNKRGQAEHLPIKIEHTHRDISKVISNELSLEDLILLRPNKYGNLWKLTKQFISQKHFSTLQA